MRGKKCRTPLSADSTDGKKALRGHGAIIDGG